MSNNYIKLYKVCDNCAGTGIEHHSMAQKANAEHNYPLSKRDERICWGCEGAGQVFDRFVEYE